jgi:hypothetical protein
VFIIIIQEGPFILSGSDVAAVQEQVGRSVQRCDAERGVMCRGTGHVEMQPGGSFTIFVALLAIQ